MKKLLVLLFVICLFALACDSNDSEQERPPTAMQLIQGNWQFSSAQTLQMNQDLASKARIDSTVAAKLAELENSYFLTLTPLALYAKEGQASREYVIKAVSDDNKVLVLAIQLKDAPDKHQWLEYTFTVENDIISVDMPDKGGILAFQRVAGN